MSFLTWMFLLVSVYSFLEALVSYMENDHEMENDEIHPRTKRYAIYSIVAAVLATIAW